MAVLAVLSFAGAAILGLLGIIAFAAGGFVSNLVSDYGPASWIVGAGAVFVGMGFLIFAAINGVMGWGLWTGQGWAWGLTVVFEGIWALLSLLGLLGGDVESLVPLAIAGGILWYLFRPWVRRFFGHHP